MFWRLNHIQMRSFTFAAPKKKNESGAKGETQQTSAELAGFIRCKFSLQGVSLVTSRGYQRRNTQC